MKKLLLTPIICLILLCLFSCSGECRHFNIKTTESAPDCSKEGYALNVCEDCGFTYKSDIVAPKGHTFTTKNLEPTCDKTGYTEYSCDCGFSYISDYVAPTAHTLVSEKSEPTCVAEGFTTYSCECGFSYKSDIVAPLGHVFDEKRTAPTCTTLGYTEFSCKSCDESYRAEYITPLGHSYKQTVSRPTYLSTGYTSYKCDCGFEYVGSFVMSSDIYTGAYIEADAPLAMGADLSKWNGEIDFKQLKALGIDFVILKVGSTKSGLDPAFEANYKAAKAAGIDVGAYFYTYSTTLDGAHADAALCAKLLSGKQFEYPIYFDLEDVTLEGLDRELLTQMCEAFIGDMQELGWFCGLYVNHDWLMNRLHTERATVYFDIWYARWTLSGTPEWKEGFGEKMGLWQYTDSGVIGDFEGKFDLNVAYKDYPTIIKKYKLNGF